MKLPLAVLRLPQCVMAMAIVSMVPACDSKKADGNPSPVSQEATKKSLQASGDFYKQQHQTKK